MEMWLTEKESKTNNVGMTSGRCDCCGRWSPMMSTARPFEYKGVSLYSKVCEQCRERGHHFFLTIRHALCLECGRSVGIKYPALIISELEMKSGLFHLDRKPTLPSPRSFDTNARVVCTSNIGHDTGLKLMLSDDFDAGFVITPKLPECNVCSSDLWVRITSDQAGHVDSHSTIVLDKPGGEIHDNMVSPNRYRIQCSGCNAADIETGYKIIMYGAPVVVRVRENEFNPGDYKHLLQS